jgi:hypothetical protein
MNHTTVAGVHLCLIGTYKEVMLNAENINHIMLISRVVQETLQNVSSKTMNKLDRQMPPNLFVNKVLAEG